MVGASAGGVTALQTVLGDLPGDLPASVFVVVHASGRAGALRSILSRGCAMPVVEPEGPVSDLQAGDRDDVFGCPECGGPVTVTDEGGLLRFRCRVGHAWSEMSFMAGQSAEVEGALWAALRALEERGVIAERLAGRARDRGQGAAAERFRERAAESAERARVVRDLIESLAPLPALAEEAER